MAALRSFLDSHAFREIYPLIAGDALFCADRTAALATVRDLALPYRMMLELFALHEPVERSDLSPALEGVVAALSQLDLLVVTETLVSTNGWVVAPVLGGLLMTGAPPTYGPGAGVGAAAYVGPDSVRLAACLPDATGKRVLDLGCGSGIQGLLGVRGAREVVCTDIEERSVQLTELNAMLNRCAHPVRVLAGDCFDPVDDEQFDLIVTLPPYVPTVAGSAARSTVASGPDGLDVLRRVLRGAHRHLSPGGELFARCQLLCDDQGPLVTREFNQLQGLDCRLVLSHWHPLQPYILELASSLATHGSPSSLSELMAAYGTSLRGLGATGVCTALICLRRPFEGRPMEHRQRWSGAGRIEVLGRAPSATPLAGVRRMQGVEIHQDPTVRAVTGLGSTPLLLDGATAALLGAVDGSRTIRQVAAQAWGVPEGAGQADLEDQALVRLAHLERAGVVAITA